MAEIEIGFLDRQGLDRRLPIRTPLAAELAAWQQRRNAEGRGIAWAFTRQDADRKMGQHHGSQLMGRTTRSLRHASSGSGSSIAAGGLACAPPSVRAAIVGVDVTTSAFCARWRNA